MRSFICYRKKLPKYVGEICGVMCVNATQRVKGEKTRRKTKYWSTVAKQEEQNTGCTFVGHRRGCFCALPG